MVRTIDHTMTASSATMRDGDHGHHDRGLDAVALPGDGDVARPVGDPDHAEGHQRDEREEEKDADHRTTAPPSARRRRRRQAAGWRRWPCCAPRPWRSRPAPGRGRRRAACRARSARRRHCRATPAARRATGSPTRSSPRGSSSTGRTRTSFSALACRRSRNPASAGVWSDARSIGRTIAASSCPSAALPGTPDAANGSSGAMASASGASGLTMASSAVNGSPRSTALRSAEAATASREARSLPAAAARAVVCTSASAAVSFSIRPLVSRSAASAGFGAAGQRGGVVGERLRSRSPPR